MSQQERSRVLVVDSNPRTAEAVRVALPSAQYEVVAAPDSARALTAIREERVDAVLSELVLPDANGLHLLVEARLRNPLLPRIVVTALRDFDAAVAAVNEAEVFRILSKPLDRAAVLGAVSDALGRAETLHQARSVQEQADRRRLALIDLEADFPGISVVSRTSEGYFIPSQRLKALSQCLQGRPLGEVLASSLDNPSPSEP